MVVCGVLLVQLTKGKGQEGERGRGFRILNGLFDKGLLELDAGHPGGALDNLGDAAKMQGTKREFFERIREFLGRLELAEII